MVSEPNETVSQLPFSSISIPSIGQDPFDPEVAQVISSIMDHSERVEEQFALNTAADPSDVVQVKANSHLKEQSLSILDNLVCFPTGEWTSAHLLTAIEG